MNRRHSHHTKRIQVAITRKAVYLGGLLFLLAMSHLANAQMQTVSTINTIAGNGVAGFSGDGGPALSAQFNFPRGLAIDGQGNLYISDFNNNRVRKITPSGIITTIAGTGAANSTGDGGPAASAALHSPEGIAIDSAGNIYVCEWQGARIRKINAVTGIITTFAGNGVAGYTGNGGPATSAKLNGPQNPNFDSNGNFYFADYQNNVVREINMATGIITTVAGNHIAGSTGDGGPATSAELNGPVTVTFDTANNMYVSERNGARVRTVAAGTGIISTFAGTGVAGYSGDGGPATSARLNLPYGISFDIAGNVLIADVANSRVREVNLATGIITTVAGNGVTGFSGDGGPATTAKINNTIEIIGSNSPNQFYIADAINNRIREISPSTSSFQNTNIGSSSSPVNVLLATTATETITSITVPQSQGGKQEYSVGTISGCTINGATVNPVNTTCTIPITFSPEYPGRRWVPLKVVTSTGNINFGLMGIGVGPLAVLTPSIVSASAGNGTAGYAGDGGTSTSAEIDAQQGIVSDYAGNIYIADNQNNRIRKVDATTGSISTIAGIGTAGYFGDGGAATSAELNSPQAIAIDAAGNLYVADKKNNVIRKINAATGMISTVAGNGIASYSGDGGVATSAQLSGPLDVMLDNSGDLYIADNGNARVREINVASGIITTAAGNGANGYSGDGGISTSAEINNIGGLASDNNGNLYIADTGNNVVREVKRVAGSITGTISTIAGNGTAGYSGDGGAATSAELDAPSRLITDAANNIYVADSSNNRVRKINAAVATIGTIAGIGTAGYSGDGGVATSAELNNPVGLAFDSANGLYVSDSGNNRIRKLNLTMSALNYPTPTMYESPDTADDPQTAILSNIGNAALTISIPASGSNPNISTNFLLGSSTTCPDLSTSSSAAMLASGSECTIAIDFDPTTVGTLTGAAIITDNSLNTAGSTQTIGLTAAAIPVTTTTTVVSSVNPSSYMQSVTFTANVAQTTGTAQPTGTVQFSIDGTNVGGPATLSNGIASFTISMLAVGLHTIAAVYTPGSGNFVGSSGSTGQRVGSVPISTTTLTVSPTTVMYGNTATLTAVVTPAFATGTVSFYEGTTLVGTASLDNTATAVLPISTLNAGMHTITATYNGDPGVPASTSNAVQLPVTQRTAPGGGPAITITANNASRTATQSNPPFTYSPSGQLVNGDTYSSAISGTANYSASGGTTPGTYSITVSGLISQNYLIGFVPGTLTVTISPSTTTLAASPTSTPYGDPVTLTATVTSGATGTVSFYDGSVLLGTSAVSNGVATLITTMLIAGTHSITAVYNGDATYASSQSSPAAVTVAKRQGPGGGAALTITVQNESREYDTADPQFNYVVTGTLVNGDAYATAVTGIPVYFAADITASPSGSTFPISVSGLMSANYEIAFVNGMLTIVAAPTTTTLATSANSASYGEPITLTATVAPSGATGTALFTQGSNVLGTATVTNGVATLTTLALNVGTYTITAIYLGDGNYGASTSTPVILTINPLTLTVTITDASRLYGQGNPAFTYTVTGALVNGDTYATAITGVPVYSTSAIPTSPVGSYPISAAGLNSTNYVMAFVNGTLTVIKATPGQNGAASVTLTSSPNPSAYGQAVTLTATVPSTATGAVTFYYNGTALGTATVSNGTANITISTLPIGSDPLTAVYSGDLNWNDGTSAAETQVVEQPDFAVNVTSGTPQTIPPGSAATLGIAVSYINSAFNNSVTLTVTTASGQTGLPAGAKLTFSPSSVTPGGGTASSTLTVQTSSTIAANRRSNPWGLGTASLALLLPLLGLRCLRKKFRSFPGVVLLALASLLSLGALTSMSGCGAGAGYFGGPPKTYTFTVTGTSGSLTHTAPQTITLTIQ